MADATARAVASVQGHLEAIYDLDAPARAADCLLDDGDLDALVAAGLLHDPRPSREHVLVLPSDEGLEVGVYFDARVRQGVADGPGLQEHCWVTEGVSHFLMLAWSAQNGRAVRAVDLELQAEIDKAVTCLLLDLQGGGLRAESLLRRLFDAELLRLPDALRARYREAHRLAERYAWHLLALLRDGVERLLVELRTFYRLDWPGRRARVLAV